MPNNILSDTLSRALSCRTLVVILLRTYYFTRNVILIILETFLNASLRVRACVCGCVRARVVVVDLIKQLFTYFIGFILFM